MKVSSRTFHSISVLISSNSSSSRSVGYSCITELLTNIQHRQASMAGTKQRKMLSAQAQNIHIGICNVYETILCYRMGGESKTECKIRHVLDTNTSIIYTHNLSKEYTIEKISELFFQWLPERWTKYDQQQVFFCLLERLGWWNTRKFAHAEIGQFFLNKQINYITLKDDQRISSSVFVFIILVYF